MKKQDTGLIIGGIVLLVGILFLSGTLSFDRFAIGDEDTIYKQRWGVFECNEDQTPESIFNVVPEELFEETEYKCGVDALTDECEFWVVGEETLWWQSKPAIKYKVCEFVGTGCSDVIYKKVDESQYEFLVEVPSGKSLFIARTNPWEITLQNKIHPYRLYSREGGKWLVNSADCCLIGQKDLSRRDVLYGEWDCLDKGDFRNYMIDWIPTIGGEIYDYNGEDVMCANAILYEFEEVKMANDNTYKFQMEAIKGVECCPHTTSFCNDDFEFTQEPTPVECTVSSQCENGGNPIIITDTTARQESCISNKCVSAEITIECGSDAKCRELYGTGYVCDKKLNNFGVCIATGTIVQPYCGDGDCQTGETTENCLEDCGPEKEEQSLCTFLEPLAFFKITKDKCTDGGIILIGGIFLLIIIAMQLGGKR